MKLLTFVLLTTILLTGCSVNKNWTGYYYPDLDNIGDESTWVIQTGFKTINECQNWINQVVDSSTNFDYECVKD